MDFSRKIVWNLYAGGIAAVTALVTKKGLDAAWLTVTGEEPPEANDPSTPTSEALAWALALAVGLGVTQVMVNRFAAKRWEQFTGEASPVRSVSLRL